MAETMKLHWSPRSPYVRKVMIAAHEMGLADRLQTVRTVVGGTTPHLELMRDNPLGKIPTLELAGRHDHLQLAGDLRVSRHAARRTEAVSRRGPSV